LDTFKSVKHPENTNPQKLESRTGGFIWFFEKNRGFLSAFREKPRIIEMIDRAKLIKHQDDSRFFEKGRKKHWLVSVFKVFNILKIIFNIDVLAKKK